MGYAIIMFGVLLAAIVVMSTVVTYGIAKDSQTAPLKARNIYAGIKTEQAQTGLTIVNTCLSGSDRYTIGQGSNTISGPYILYLNVSNNGSIVLNSTKATVIYNNSFTTFTTSGNVWTPMKNATMQVSNVYIPSPNSPAPGTALRLLVAAENGVSAIAPTTITNFTVYSAGSNNNTDVFTWDPSQDQKGIYQYIVYGFLNSPPSQCPWDTTPYLSN
jgi:hypothetical protein